MGTRAWPALVGREGRGLVVGPEPDQGHEVPGLLGDQTRRRLVLVLELARLGEARQARRPPRAVPVGMADPRLPWFLVPRPGGWGLGGHRRRASREPPG